MISASLATWFRRLCEIVSSSCVMVAYRPAFSSYWILGFSFCPQGAAASLVGRRSSPPAILVVGVAAAIYLFDPFSS